MSRTPLDLHVARPEELRARIAAERRGTPFLLYRDGEDRQVIVELGEGRDRRHARTQLAGRHRAALGPRGLAAACDARADRRRLGACRRAPVAQRHVRQRRAARHAPPSRTAATSSSPARSTIAFVAPGPGSASATAVGDVHVPPVTPAQRRVLVALCRPLADGGAPASNREIAAELVVAVDTVKGTLSRLFETLRHRRRRPAEPEARGAREASADWPAWCARISSRSASPCRHRSR